MTEDMDNEAKLDRLLKHPRVKKFMARETKLDRKHRIPFLAGYSVDGKTIYIDSSTPKSFDYRGRKVDTDKFLILHEELEKALLDGLGWEYLGAHRIAIVAERRCVRSAGIKWAAYDRFMQGEIARIRALPVENVPLDLDLEPYKTEPALLEKIIASQRPRPASAPTKPPPNIPRNIPETAKAPETGPFSSRANHTKWFSIR